MAQRGEQGPLSIQHGHTDTHVLIRFTRSTDHVLLTPAEADALIEAVKASKQSLAEHTAQPN